MPAPIALFVFRRPEETLRTLEALALNDGIAASELFIFCDAPRRKSDDAAVDATRAVIRGRVWCPRTTIIERSENWGLARSIIAGVTQLTESHGEVIVIEDDLLTSKGFLNYMNHALNLYRTEDSVMQISGHMHPVSGLRPDLDSFFLPLTTSWGWATWKRAWAHFDPNAVGWEILGTERSTRNRFNLDGSYPYAEMLEQQMKGQIDSWAIRWWWTCFNRNGITLFPRTSLVSNIGFGPMATHTTQLQASPDSGYSPSRTIKQFPESVAVSRENFNLLTRHLRRQRVGLLRRVSLRIRLAIRALFQS